MPTLNLPSTIEIPFESLTNEQRNAIHTVMTGKGLDNPLRDKITACVSLCDSEIEFLDNLNFNNPSNCTMTEQVKLDLVYKLGLLKYHLGILEEHTNRLSGSSIKYVDDFFQRLSIAGSYTNIMKSITGIDRERYSYIFYSLMGAGDKCLNKCLKDFVGDCVAGDIICGKISASSGIQGIGQQVCSNASITNEVLNCFIPGIIECIEDVIEKDNLHYCQAKSIIDNYSASVRISEDAIADPIISHIIDSMFATPQLKQALLDIKQSDDTQKTDIFFPEFGLPRQERQTGENCGCCEGEWVDILEDITPDCLGSPLVVIGPAGPTGDDGTDASTGPAGPTGPPGADGDCGCNPLDVGACCFQGNCFEVQEQQCNFYGGAFYGESSECANIVCTPPPICGSDDQCDDGEICCAGSCVTPCEHSGCGVCPPCSECANCNTPCGGVCDCGEGKTCCNDMCVTECPNGGCPHCQGACCPEGTSCCGGAGCCPDSSECCTTDNGMVCCPSGQSCCDGECCDGGCCGGECCEGRDCCGGKCCEVGVPCCDGNCGGCPNGSCPDPLNCGCGCGPLQICCGGDDCCSPEKCCNGGCCPDGQMCCNNICKTICNGGCPDCGGVGCCSESEPCCSADGICEPFCTGTTVCPNPLTPCGPCGCDDDEWCCESSDECCSTIDEPCCSEGSGCGPYCPGTSTCPDPDRECGPCGCNDFMDPDNINRTCCNDVCWVSDDPCLKCCQQGVQQGVNLTCCEGSNPCGKDDGTAECCGPGQTCVYGTCCPFDDCCCIHQFDDCDTHDPCDPVECERDNPGPWDFGQSTSPTMGGDTGDQDSPAPLETIITTAVFGNELESALKSIDENPAKNVIPGQEGVCLTSIVLRVTTRCNVSMVNDPPDNIGEPPGPNHGEICLKTLRQFITASESHRCVHPDDPIIKRWERDDESNLYTDDEGEHCTYIFSLKRRTIGGPCNCIGLHQVEPPRRWKEEAKWFPKEPPYPCHKCDTVCSDTHNAFVRAMKELHGEPHATCSCPCGGPGEPPCEPDRSVWIPDPPCSENREFCVDENGIGNCCKENETCCGGECKSGRGICCYSEVTKKYSFCSGGCCNKLDADGNVICKDINGNCPSIGTESTILILPEDRTYGAFLLDNSKDNISIEKSFDGGGRLLNFKVSSKPVVGAQDELSVSIPLSKPVNTQSKIITAPVQFQIVNFVADDGIKSVPRPASRIANAQTDSKSNISVAELRDTEDLGIAGFEGFGTSAKTIKGSMTATIQSDGILGNSQVISFVSGSNIRLDTNEASNIIRISVDDLNLFELVDIDAESPDDNDILQWDSSSSKWKAVAIAQGEAGDTGPIGGSDKQILYSDGVGASGSPNLTFDYDTNTVGITATVDLNQGFTAGDTCYFQDNEVNRAKLKDYSEVVYDNGDLDTSPTILSFGNGNVQKLRITFGGTMSFGLVNPPPSNSNGTMTLIITDGATNGNAQWPGTVKWAGGTAPSLSASGTDIVTIMTNDNGTSYYGFVGGIGFS